MSGQELTQREPWLTKRELAAALKISPRTVERLRIPPTMRVGGQNRYQLSEVETFLSAAPAPSAEVIRMAEHR